MRSLLGPTDQGNVAGMFRYAVFGAEMGQAKRVADGPDVKDTCIVT